MTSRYSVSVSITAARTDSWYSWAILQGNDIPHDAAATYGLCDPLTITQRIADSELGILAHPEPDEATVSLIAASSTDYADIALGDPVAIYWWPAASQVGTPVTFFGRIAAIAGEPHPLGVKLTYSCVDYTTDLTQLTAGTVDYPQETAAARLNRITAEAGIPDLPVTLGSFPTRQVAARSASPSDAYSLIREVLDAATNRPWRDPVTDVVLPVPTNPAHTAPKRGYLVANIVDDFLDPVTPFSIRMGGDWARRIQYAPPARVTNVGGVYSVTSSAADSSPATGAPIAAASRVELAPSFAQTKGGGLPNVTIGVDAQGNRYTWDWRVEPGYSPGGGAIVGKRLIPYDIQQPSGGTPALVQEVTTILDVSDAGAQVTPATQVNDYRVPFRPSTVSDWVVGTLSWQWWAEAWHTYAWTGTPDFSASTEVTAGVTRTNLFPKPSFEATTDLAPGGGNFGALGVWSFDSTMSLSGTTSLKLAIPSGASPGWLGTQGPQVALGAGAGGAAFTFSVAARRAAGSGNFQLGVDWFDASNAYLSSSYTAPLPVPTGAWDRVSITATAPAGAAYAMPLMFYSSFVAGTDALNLDRVLFEKSPTMGAWFDGSSVNAQLRPDLTQLLTVAGVESGSIPSNREWVVGLVTGTTLRVAKGRTVLDVDLAPNSLDYVANREQLGASLGVASLDSPALSGVTLAQLNARDTLSDYMIVRGS